MSDDHEHDWRDRIAVEGTRVRIWIECAVCGAEGVEVPA